ETVENWNAVFFITVSVYVVCALFYAIFASAEHQSWGKEKKEIKTASQANECLLANSGVLKDSTSQKRCVFMILGFLGMFLLFATRVNLSVALVAMVSDSRDLEFNSFNTSIGCYNLLRNDTHLKEKALKGIKYNWDPKNSRFDSELSLLRFPLSLKYLENTQ
ncbi:hypothetical protein CEXT_628191, partial [Caerostris extrusa]